MKTLYFDCFSGISGDMALGALLGLGVDQEVFLKELKKLGLEGYEIKIERTVKNGISANYVKVVLADWVKDYGDQQNQGESHNHHGHAHEHSHDHTHGHEHPHPQGDHVHGDTHSHTHDHSHPQGSAHDHNKGDGHLHNDHSHEHSHGHRNYKDIQAIIDGSAIAPGAKALAKNIFYRVAKAEARVHNSTPEEVHFHEVGAVDSIVDIVGTAILIDMIKPDRIVASVVNDGQGFTYCQHGIIPVPVPAVMAIFDGCEKDIKFRQIDIDKELVTPTGAAIIAEVAESFGEMPVMTPVKTAYGAGTRNNKIPNVLRIIQGETADTAAEQIAVLETNLDDTTAEVLGYVMERLMAAGARDVFFTSIYMKKNRPAVKLTVLASPDKIQAMEDVLFTETTTLGVRRRIEERSCLNRRFDKLATPYGDVTVKIAFAPSGGERVSFEYEEVKALAQEYQIPLQKMYTQLYCQLNP